MSEDSKEKRLSRRVPTKFKVDWKSEGTFLYENATNISEHGIFIETDKPMDPGTMIELQFTSPDTEKKIEVLGEVAWANPLRPQKKDNYNPGMGIRFVNLNEIDKEMILSLIKRIAVL
ncbi:MAG: TIGR02266 family protein [Pseudomonadota bacterium]